MNAKIVIRRRLIVNYLRVCYHTAAKGVIMKQVLVVGLLSVLLTGCNLPFLPGKKAALQVNAEPQANVFLNGNHVGQTPFFDENLKPGEYMIKIQSNEYPSQPWEASVSLNPKVVTVVQRNFGATADTSSNYIIQMESLADEKATEVAIVTIPDNVIVKLDNQPEGFSPISLKDISEGDHSIILSAPSYKDEQINLNVRAGFKMIISASLARTQVLPEPMENQEATPSAEVDDGESQSSEATASSRPQTTGTPRPSPSKLPSPTKSPSPSVTQKPSSSAGATPSKPYVEILETGTGWLRVRSAPNGNADNEVARVDVGDTFPFVEDNEEGWYKIEYETGSEGWIAARYGKLVE